MTHVISQAGHVTHARSVALVVEVFVAGAEALGRVLRGEELGAKSIAVVVAELTKEKGITKHGRVGGASGTPKKCGAIGQA